MAAPQGAVPVPRAASPPRSTATACAASPLRGVRAGSPAAIGGAGRGSASPARSTGGKGVKKPEAKFFTWKKTPGGQAACIRGAGTSHMTVYVAAAFLELRDNDPDLPGVFQSFHFNYSKYYRDRAVYGPPEKRDKYLQLAGYNWMLAANFDQALLAHKGLIKMGKDGEPVPVQATTRVVTTTDTAATVAAADAVAAVTAAVANLSPNVTRLDVAGAPGVNLYTVNPTGEVFLTPPIGNVSQMETLKALEVAKFTAAVAAAKAKANKAAAKKAAKAAPDCSAGDGAGGSGSGSGEWEQLLVFGFGDGKVLADATPTSELMGEAATVAASPPLLPTVGNDALMEDSTFPHVELDFEFQWPL